MPEEAREWKHRQQKLQSIILGIVHRPAYFLSCCFKTVDGSTSRAVSITDRPHAKLTNAVRLPEGGGADVVCIQEASADSFESDFQFMVAPRSSTP